MRQKTMSGWIIQSWWVLAWRGVAAIAFGAIALILPGITLTTLVALFGTFALLGGAVSIFGAVDSARHRGDWWIPLLLGLTSCGAGAIALLHPGLSALILVLLIGAHALVIGAIDLISAAHLTNTWRGGWLIALSGALSMLFGALVFLFPASGALALIWLISLYALLTGAILVTAAVWVRGQAHVPFTGRERRVNPDRRGAHAR
jgi:uncharacterized membrane protein HdeD (DUF308 family)